MRQPKQFARRAPTLPATSPVRTPERIQIDFARPISHGGTIGFACLSVSLAALTFVATTWGGQLAFDVPISDLFSSQAAASATSTPLPAPAVSAEADIVLEPKTTERLPIFGGIIPSGH